MVYIARIDKNGQEQRLTEHSDNVASLAKEWAKSINLSKFADTAGLYHDAGKATDEFQSYIKNKDARRGSVHHSIYGAKGAYEDYNIYHRVAEILANIIAAHHGSLRDFLSPDGDTPLASEIHTSEKSLRPEESSHFTPDELMAELQTIAPFLTDKSFGFMMLTKMLYSCLVDADRLDAYLFESGINIEDYKEPEPNWDKMLSELDKRLTEMKADTSSQKNADREIFKLRNSISEQCANSGLRDRGIYKLEVPTGGGKTLSSLRFALTHAKKHGMHRIIYIIPYLSILSQTADEIRKALGSFSDVVLEHHSNILPDDREYYKLHTDRWDAPIILTSQVQLLESIFSAKGSDLRKLHNMANSVMIFDEIQSLPVKCVHLFNSAMNFLNRVCGTTVLLCTATQPLLDTVKHKILMSECPSIAICGEITKRTVITPSLKAGGYSTDELKNFVLDKHNESTLVIVNTKKAAKELYTALSADYKEILHLSTNMCPKHRDEVISNLRSRLEKHEKVICVSTQLIEAGIDISFECVIRDLAGLDSIYQAAGRCNRHNEFKRIMNVYVINIAGENLDRLPDIKIGAEKTQTVFDEGQPNIENYYKYYFYERRGIMDYPTTGGGSIMDLLTKNKQGQGAYKTHAGSKPLPTLMTSAIKTASDEFYVIAPGQTDVVVPYDDSESLLDEYRMETDIEKKRQLLRRLGRYSVSMYAFQLNELCKRWAVSEIDGIKVLADGFYDSELGIDITGSHTFLNA